MFAKGAGWFAWERADGVRVTFNQLGGVARPLTPWCRRDRVFPTTTTCTRRRATSLWAGWSSKTCSPSSRWFCCRPCSDASAPRARRVGRNPPRLTRLVSLRNHAALTHQAFNIVSVPRQVTRPGGSSGAEVVWSAISARRFTAFARRTAASRAIVASATFPTRGALRSSAAMSSRSLRATSVRVTATGQLRWADHGVGRRSISRRTVRNANSWCHRDVSRSS